MKELMTSSDFEKESMTDRATQMVKLGVSHEHSHECIPSSDLRYLLLSKVKVRKKLLRVGLFQQTERRKRPTGGGLD